MVLPVGGAGLLVVLPVGGAACWWCCLFGAACLVLPVSGWLLLVKCVCGECVQDFWASPPDPPPPDRLSPGPPPNFRSFFFPSPATVSLVLCLSGGLLVEFLVVFVKTRTLICARLGSRAVV